MPTLADVKDKVKEDVITRNAVAVAKTRADAMAKAAAKGNFAAAAKSAGVDVKTTDLVTRGSPYPEIGVNSTVDTVVFALKKGETTAPIATDTAVVVARVADRQDAGEAAFAAQKDSLRNEMLQQKQQDFFVAYMNKAKEKLDVRYNENTIRTILGGS